MLHVANETVNPKGHLLIIYDDVMETLSMLLTISAENSPVIGDFHAQSQWCWALFFSWICALINIWVNIREAGDLLRHRAHYDFTVMNAFE